MRSILYDYTPQEMQDLLDNSTSYADLLRTVGINPKGGNPATLKKIIEEFDLDETKLNENRKNLYKECAYKTHGVSKYPIEDILNNKYPKYQSSRLLQRLVKDGYKEYKCEKCGISEWNGLPISLQLHHKDGNHINNNLENLEILCPNCHTQTDTFGGKWSNLSKRHTRKDKLDKPSEVAPKIKVPFIPRVSRSELKDKIRNNSFIDVAHEYGVSDDTIRNWCTCYGLPRKIKEINSYSNEEWRSL